MKTVVAPYETSAFCLRIVCTNGLTLRLTRYPTDLKMSNGQVYVSSSGYDVTSFQSTSNFAASVVDLEGFVGMAGVTHDALSSGIFDNARAYMFKTNFFSPVEDEEEVMASILGKTRIEDDRYVIEDMALIDVLSQSTGRSYTALCSHTFGDSRCQINLAGITVTGTLTGVNSASVLRDSARTEAVDYFAGGYITITSGPNVGVKSSEIKSYAADGTITLYEPLYYLPVGGETYSMVPGCRKRKVDCQAWGNVENAMAFWDIPTGSSYSKIGGMTS